MSVFTPEQQAEIDKQVAAAKEAIHVEYDNKAHWLRERIKAHPVPMANFAFWFGLLIGALAGWYGNSIITRLFG